MHKLKILFNALCGELLKVYYRFCFGEVSYGLNKEEQREKRIIVSLTSYGRRVSDSLPYTIISLLRQTRKPDVVVVWLDSDQWNDKNLPLSLVRLKEKGITVCYCADNLKSYTKLIPSLKTYPNDLIITVDDDIYYSKRMVENLYKSYLSYPKSIHALCTLTYEIEVNDTINGRRLFTPCFQTGYGGVLYPPHSLSEKVFDRELFMGVCSTADDLWFYIMVVLNGKQIIEVEQKQRVCYYYVDLFYQYTHQGSRLYDSIKYNNVEMLKELIQYFNISIDHIEKSTIKI